mmetsp:Transcript_47706/g.83997  ORF Transcript_47706/g.83997 Transcript_47706/m.83997 type:complete len:99 (-) Transcript_47706:60-356(-)
MASHSCREKCWHEPDSQDGSITTEKRITGEKEVISSGSRPLLNASAAHPTWLPTEDAGAAAAASLADIYCARAFPLTKFYIFSRQEPMWQLLQQGWLQ